MVKSIINVRRSSICWRSEELTTDVRNQKSWLWRQLCRRRAIYWLFPSPQTCHAKPKLKSTGAGRYQLLPVGGMPTALKSSAAWLLSESQDAVALQQIKERGALPMIDRGDIRSGNRPLQQYLASLPGAGYGQSEHKADSLIAKFKEAAERSERLMYEQSHRDYLRSGYLHHRLPVMYC